MDGATDVLHLPHLNPESSDIMNNFIHSSGEQEELNDDLNKCDECTLECNEHCIRMLELEEVLTEL
jgi:hypothetical protein